jgi:hypothetical protein
MLGGDRHLKGLYRFSIQTLEWMIRDRQRKIKSIEDEVKMIKNRIKELKKENR